MQCKHPVSLIKFVAGALLALGASLQLQAADPSGTWTWSRPGRDGGEPRKSTLKLKVEGENVTGTLSTPGRDGQAREAAISDAKLKGEDISFNVVREFNGNKITTKYAGKISGDSIKGKMETQGRDGEARSVDWEAKREK